MTKSVRIENADTGPYKVIVEIYQKGVINGPDTLVQTVELGHPTAMLSDYLTSHRYMIVREAPLEPSK